jgi:hypothetical protein
MYEKQGDKMISTPTKGVGLGGKALILLAGLALAVVGMLALAQGQAKANGDEQFSMDFTNGQVNLGFAFKGAEILPASATLGDTPLPDLWDARDTVTLPGEPGVDPSSFKPVGCLSPVTFTVTWPGAPGTPVPNDGQGGDPDADPVIPNRPFTPNPDSPCDPNPTAATVSGDKNADNEILISETDFRFPIMIVPNPLDGSPVPITLMASDDITGTVTAEGDLNLEGPIEVWVLTGLATNPLGSYCSLPLPNRGDGGGLKLTSGFSLPTAVGFNGTPFDSLAGPGALTGTWDVTANSVSVGGADCSTVDSVSKGLGGIWLGVDIADPAPFPTCEDEGKIGTFPNCAVPKATIGKVTVKGPGNVKRNRGATWKVRIPNTGNVPATGVRVSAAGRGVKVSGNAGSIAAGKNKTVTLKVKKLRRVGKFTVTIRVTSGNAGSKTVKRVVRVRK